MNKDLIEYLDAQLPRWASELGFQQLGITDCDLGEHDKHLQRWLKARFHGNMQYMEKHGAKRSHPAELIPGTLRIISVRMDYLPQSAPAEQTLENPDLAYIARYALGKDYHRLMRKRLKKLIEKIQAYCQQYQFRPFVDSAPVLEKALAEKSGLGWIGKNTLLIHPKAGSWFFLGEIFTDLPLTLSPQSPLSTHCGSCRACLDICPTNAFTKAHQLDARKCIAYLTIEHKDSIPIELRPLMGNRIFGCDDCQLVCPWNKFAKLSQEIKFQPNHELDRSRLVTLFNWSETEFLARTLGSPLRRVGYQGWLRNIAVALGNSEGGEEVINALRSRYHDPSDLVREHVHWALARLAAQQSV